MKYIIFTLAILLCFVSCTDNSKSETAVFEATTKSLEQSSKTISDISADYRKQLFEMLHDPKNAGQAAVWQPTAARISELASSTIEYINTLKSQLGGKYDNYQVVRKVFFQQNKGEELYKRLKGFIDSINTTTPENNYNTHLRRKFDYLDSVKYDEKGFTQAFFKQVSTAAALSMLAKFENDIRNIEKEIVISCYYRTFGGCILQYETFQALIGLNSSCVKAGDEIELNAGIGSFSKAAQPVFSIDGNRFLTDENGIVSYKFKTPQKAGTYSKVVKIEFTKPDGTKESMTKNLEYTVIEPK